MSLRVLYEDNHLIAVYKPACVLVQGDETGDPCLMDEVKEYIKETYKKPGNVFLGLLHRLDRPVAGIVLFAKTSKGASRISEQFRNRTIKKTYTAIIEGIPDRDECTLIHYLKKDEKKNKVTVYEQPTPEALRAELFFRIIRKKTDRAMVEVELKTGRPHQIRAQLSTIGCPILGDVKYGASQPLPDGSIALAATYLEFTTATGGERKSVTILPPFIF